jgi:hypothetical protein
MMRRPLPSPRRSSCASTKPGSLTSIAHFSPGIEMRRTSPAPCRAPADAERHRMRRATASVFVVVFM